MTLCTNNTATDTTASSAIGYVYVLPPLRVAPDLRGLLWARELKLYLDMRRPRVGPCGCRRCREDEEDEYWDTLICDGCGGVRTVASPCCRCDSVTYGPMYPGAARKGPPTGFGPYKETT